MFLLALTVEVDHPQVAAVGVDERFPVEPIPLLLVGGEIFHDCRDLAVFQIKQDEARRGVCLCCFGDQR